MSAGHLDDAAVRALREADAESRRVATTRFDVPIALEAGAGTGKTSTLVARLVRWCLGPGWDAAGDTADPTERARETARGVAAVTFTEAAAAEMAERTALAFAQVAAGEREEVVGLPDVDAAERERELARAPHLLAAVDLLEIGTIHAFCARILRDQALQLGIHPAFRVDADGEGTAQVVRSVVARLWPAMLESGDANAVRLAARGLTASEVANGVAALATAGVPSEALEVDPAQLAAEPLDALGEASRRLLDLLAGKDFGRSTKKPQEFVEALSTFLGDAPGDDASPLDRAHACFDAAADTPVKWSKGADAVQKAVAKVVDPAELQEASQVWCEAWSAVAKFDPVLFGACASVVAPMLREADILRRREGWLAFDDLLAWTARWARGGGPGVAAWRRRVRQLVVDEFQDTDARQCDLVRALALEGPVDARPSLFVVGDPKQSIYAWRAADLAAYESLLDRVRAEGGEVRTLSVNHRSSQDVLDEVARVLEPHLVHEAGVQAAFQPLVVPKVPRHPASPAGLPSVEHWSSWPLEPDGSPQDKPRSHAITRAEIRAVVRDIVATRAANPELEWSAFGVLMRSTSDQEMLLREMREAGVPFQVARERSFWHHVEVRDAGLLLRTVLDPSDRVALVGWLRSPHVGVPDAAFTQLAGRGLLQSIERLGVAEGATAADVAPVLREIENDLAGRVPGLERVAGWSGLAAERLARLAELRGLYATAALDVFVETARRLSAQEAGESARRLGRRRVANLDAFFAELLARGERSAASYGRLLPSPSRTRGNPDVHEARARDAVAVTTIHGAKDSSTASCTSCTGTSAARAQRRRTTRSHVRCALFAAGRYELELFGVPSPGFAAAQRRRERVDEAEQARLLYVAVTRAVAARRVRDVAARPTDARAGQGALDRRPRRAPSTARPPGALRDGARGGYDGVRRRVRCALRLPHARRERGAARRTRRRRFGERSVRAHGRRRRRAGRPASRSGRAAAPPLRRDGLRRPPERGGGPRARAAEEHAASYRAAPRQVVGTQIHAMLARRASSANATGSARSCRARARARGRRARAAGRRFDELERALRDGPFLAKLDALVADGDVEGPFAELPLLLANDDTSGPASHYTGSADLVHRDGAGWCVVDFKTDRVDDATLAAHESRYAPQLRRYAEALRRALALDGLPRRELWWLERGAVSTFDEADPGRGAAALRRRGPQEA
ncbi:MAG: UvrD-helicase domain-containing protein [Planctomycetota bacterium]